ncbi:acyl carrier protein [Streptomyces sp. NPDC059816]|uniref:acyl carrier protein n=1 Tax=Streptomyces sp. NPDC059816 TaxID=3346960 RepID=UPI00365FDF02
MTAANTPNTHDLEKELLEFLAERTKTAWDADTDLFGDGGLSSLFAMQVVVHLEKTYTIAVRGADLRLDNFRTVRRMAELVDRLRAPGAGGRHG